MKQNKSRKIRLKKIAAATELLEGLLLELRKHYFKLDGLPDMGFSELYYIVRLAKKAK